MSFLMRPLHHLLLEIPRPRNQSLRHPQIFEVLIPLPPEEFSRERAGLNQRLNTLQRRGRFNTQVADRDLLRQVCLGVTQWLEKADESNKIIVLEALQVSVEATASTATLTGILPLKPPEFIKDEHTCRCLFSGE